MRTSGGRGAEAWMLAIPVIALLAAGAMGEGGLGAALVTLESAIRHTVTAGLDFVAKLF